MRYASIRNMDISNGEGVGVALFVQGCHFHCYNCFNTETWDFNGGTEWTKEIEDKFIHLADKEYITRISILGGEPLADENLDGILHLVNRIHLSLLNKTIWIYSGYTFDYIMGGIGNDKNGAFFFLDNDKKRYEIISKCDVMVDGKYIEAQKDISLHWKGSANQRVIDIKKSLEKGEIVLWE